MRGNTFPGTFEFTNLGREKASKTVRVEGDADIWRAIRPHFMSSDLDWTYDCEENVGRVFVGGFRHVGDFRRVGE